MSRIKLLLDVVSDMRALADSIQSVCDAMASDGLQDISEVKEEPQKAAPTAETKKEPEITLEQIRGILADKSRNGYTAEVRTIIQKYGADRLSDVDPKDYASIIKEAEVL